MACQAEALAKAGRASGYCALYSCLEGRRVSLNTYARMMESRVRVALTCEVLRTTAWAARPTGLSNGEWENVRCRMLSSNVHVLTAVCSAENKCVDDAGPYQRESVPAAVSIILATVVRTFSG